MASPGAVDEILSSADPGECLSRLIESLDPADTVVITPEQAQAASWSITDRALDFETPPANNDAPDALPRTVKPHEVQDLQTQEALQTFEVVGRPDHGAAHGRCQKTHRCAPGPRGSGAYGGRDRTQPGDCQGGRLYYRPGS